MMLKYELMNDCVGYEYESIIEVLGQLKNHYESCKKIYDYRRMKDE